MHEMKLGEEGEWDSSVSHLRRFLSTNYYIDLFIQSDLVNTQPEQAGITLTVISGHQFMQRNTHIPDTSWVPHQCNHIGTELPLLTKAL